MYHQIIALAVTASSLIPYANAQIATQFQSPSVAFSGGKKCSNPGTATLMTAGMCMAIPNDLLTGRPARGMNITYPIDNIDLNCPLTFFPDPLCATDGDAMPYTTSEVCIDVTDYASVLARCSNIMTGATYQNPPSQNASNQNPSS